MSEFKGHERPYSLPKGFEITDWNEPEFRCRDGLSLDAIAYLYLGLDRSLCEHQYKKASADNAELSDLKTANTLKKYFLEAANGFNELNKHLNLLIAIEEDPNLRVKRVFGNGYTAESIKEFFKVVYPDERPKFIYHDALEPISREKELLEELKNKQEEIIKLSKLVIGLTDDYGFKPVTGKALGLSEMCRTLKRVDDEGELNKDSKAKTKIKVCMSQNTVRRVLFKAFENIKPK